MKKGHTSSTALLDLHIRSLPGAGAVKLPPKYFAYFQLLSLPSVDLDIALPLTSGYAFALSFVDYLKDQHAEIAVGSVGKVAANPEQSKHLETGTTRIMGLECDFVGLRSERYTDSRIPDEVVSTLTSG